MANLILGMIVEFARDLFFEESTDSEEEENPLVLDENEPRIRIPNYVERIVPMYSDVDFKLHFRMGRSVFEALLGTVAPHLLNARGRPGMNPEKQLLCSIWVLATPDSFRSVGDRFDMPKSGVLKSLRNVCKVLNVLARNFIRMPNLDELPHVAEQFLDRTGFPGVIGAIDGTHIPIKAPHNFPERYFNRKKFYSIVLQAVCDNNLIFQDCFCGYPGSVHDSRVFRNSSIHTLLSSGNLPGDCHFLGDSAYPLHHNLIVPYKNNGHLTAAKRRFNFKLSQTRIVVEKAFGILKQRFRRLKFFDFAATENISSYILAACVLHNFCIVNNNVLDEMLEPDELVGLNNVPTNSPGNVAGDTKRDFLCYLMQ